MRSLNTYLSLIKFSHTVFALPFAIIGFVLALTQSEAPFRFSTLLLVLLCMVFARSAAMAFNRYIDRHFDARNPRTATREIPAGLVSPGSALLFTVVSSAAFVVSAYFINALCFYLSPLALLVILGYSYTKRFTPLCHLVLGVGLGLAPVGAYMAVTEAFAFSPILIGFAVFFWVAGFDIIYALQDDEFDRSHHLKSIPVYLGRTRALLLSRLFHIVSAILLLVLYGVSGLGWLYLVGWLLFSALLIYQQSIVRSDDLSRVNLAFGTTNGIASLLFCLFTCGDLLL